MLRQWRRRTCFTLEKLVELVKTISLNQQSNSQVYCRHVWRQWMSINYLNMGEYVIVCGICECIKTNSLIGVSPDSEQIASEMAFSKCGDVLCL